MVSQEEKKADQNSKPETNWEEYAKKFEEKLQNKSCAIYVWRQDKDFFLICKS